MNQTLLHNQEQAIRSFVDSLRIDDPSACVVGSFNKERHKIVKFCGEKLYVVFKRDFFKKFDDYYPSFVESNPQYRGYAESLNKDFVTIAVSEADKLVFIHPDITYWCYPALMKRFCEAYNLQRKQIKENVYSSFGEKEIKQETVYNLPMKLLEMWE